MFNKFNKFKKKIALVDENEKKISYFEILKFSKILKKKINLANPLVLLLSTNSFDSIIYYASSVINNYCIIILDAKIDLNFVTKTVKNFKPNYIFCPKNFSLSDKSLNINLSDDYKILKNSNQCLEINSLNKLLITTSGTTQNPKFVRLSSENIIDNTKKIISYLKIDCKSSTVTTLPMAYSFGLSIINTHLMSGSTIFVNKRSVIEKSFWDNFKKYKIKSFSGVPEIFKYLKKIDFEKLVPKSLNYITQAGGFLDKELWEYFCNLCSKKKIKFFSMYGQAEASPRMSYVEITSNKNVLCSIGKPLKNTRFKIIDLTSGKEIKKINFEGELVFCGKNVFMGYADSFRDLKLGNLTKNVLHTGDLAKKNKEGFFYITGRKKKISKIFGIRFDLLSIENFLKKNKVNARIDINDQYLDVYISNISDKNKTLSLLCNRYQINKNFIKISEMNKEIILTNFKKLNT